MHKLAAVHVWQLSSESKCRQAGAPAAKGNQYKNKYNKTGPTGSTSKSSREASRRSPTSWTPSVLTRSFVFRSFPITSNLIWHFRRRSVVQVEARRFERKTDHIGKTDRLFGSMRKDCGVFFVKRSKFQFYTLWFQVTKGETLT